jgi:hypothetical protein
MQATACAVAMECVVSFFLGATRLSSIWFVAAVMELLPLILTCFGSLEKEEEK